MGPQVVRLPGCAEPHPTAESGGLYVSGLAISVNLPALPLTVPARATVRWQDKRALVGPGDGAQSADRPPLRVTHTL